MDAHVLCSLTSVKRLCGAGALRRSGHLTVFGPGDEGCFIQRGNAELMITPKSHVFWLIGKRLHGMKSSSHVFANTQMEARDPKVLKQKLKDAGVVAPKVPRTPTDEGGEKHLATHFPTKD